MLKTQSITDVIAQRYSVRTYHDEPIPGAVQADLQTRLEALRAGPLGTPLRLRLVAATEQDSAALRGLGTYGFIKKPAGFIVGAAKVNDHVLEDYGYAMEQAILEATQLGLGTCWLGGSFTQSSFAQKIGKHKDELVPAVTAMGYADEAGRSQDRTRQRIRADQRRPWANLFFENGFDYPLKPESAGILAKALEMVRLGPSASNKQPWRVVKAGKSWHFFGQRTPGYGKGSWYFTLLRLADLQRLDVGIAMCHFELTANELGFSGSWKVADPGLSLPDEKIFYVASWEETIP